MSGAPPPYPGEKGAGVPAYGQPGAPAYGQPGAPAYGQPGAPAYGQPAYPQYGQPAQYNPPHVIQGANTTVVVAQPTVTLVQHFRESPVRMTCPHCRADIVTATFYETGTLTWVACFVIAVLGFWLGCCLIPFCIDACYPQGPYPQQPGYAPQPGYPQGPQIHQGQTTVVVAQPTVAVVQQFRESPVHTRCPHCQADVVTGTMYETGTFAWIICVVLCLVGCDLGCCLIPFCVDGCKDVVHQCPNCRQQIARWSRM